MSGAYLLFDSEYTGMMKLIWSKTPVKGALCYAECAKPIPEYKFQPSSRMQLAVDLRADSSKFYQGYCNFIKSIKTYNPTFILYDGEAPMRAKVILRMGDNKVVQCEKNKKYTLDGVADVACVNESTSTLSVQSATSNVFTENARASQGYAVSL